MKLTDRRGRPLSPIEVAVACAVAAVRCRSAAEFNPELQAGFEKKAGQYGETIASICNEISALHPTPAPRHDRYSSMR